MELSLVDRLISFLDKCLIQTIAASEMIMRIKNVSIAISVVDTVRALH